MTRAVTVYIGTADPPEIQRPDSPDLGHIVDTLCGHIVVDTLDTVVLQIVYCGHVSVSATRQPSVMRCSMKTSLEELCADHPTVGWPCPLVLRRKDDQNNKRLFKFI